MKFLSLLLAVLAISTAHAEDKPKTSETGEDLVKVIENYSKMTGQKFIVDPGVTGHVAIFSAPPASNEEAFNQLSQALAINGYAINKQGDTMMVRSARNAQRDLIEVGTERPSLTPERMYTWVYTLKNIPAASVNRNLRVLTSKDGELAVNVDANQLIITDWVSNLNRVAEILKAIDIKPDPRVAKMVEIEKKEAKEAQARWEKEEALRRVLAPIAAKADKDKKSADAKNNKTSN